MLTANQKKAVETAINYYTNPNYKNCYGVAHNNKYKDGNKIIFSNQTETGALYFKVMNAGKMLYIGMIYSDNITNNFECVDYFSNPKVIKKACAAFKKLGESPEKF